jgi:hypothetical protein
VTAGSTGSASRAGPVSPGPSRPASAGWAPAEPGLTLDTAEQAVLAEIALSWFTRQGDGVSRIDLRGETPGRVLWDRLRRLLVEDPRGGRVVVP